MPGDFQNNYSLSFRFHHGQHQISIRTTHDRFATTPYTAIVLARSDPIRIYQRDAAVGAQHSNRRLAQRLCTSAISAMEQVKIRNRNNISVMTGVDSIPLLHCQNKHRCIFLFTIHRLKNNDSLTRLIIAKKCNLTPTMCRKSLAKPEKIASRTIK